MEVRFVDAEGNRYRICGSKAGVDAIISRAIRNGARVDGEVAITSSCGLLTVELDSELFMADSDRHDG